MELKLKSIFKNYSPAFLLFIITVAALIPFKEASAYSLPSLSSLGDLFSFDIFGSLVDFIAKAALDESNPFFTVVFFFAFQILNIGLLIVTPLVYFGAWLVDVFLDENIYVRVLDMSDPTTAVSIGWTVIRDACNTFFVLFLLLIAFSTILRIQTFSAKSLLPRFVIAMFLINFSAIIAMLVIDFGQVFLFEIRDWMGADGFSDSGSPLTSIVDYFNNKYNFRLDRSYLIGDVVGVGFAVAYSAILGCMYIMLALFLLARIIAFVILVIISPFAFFSIILPGMRTYTSQWWNSLVSNSISGSIFLFFVFLSSQMARSMQTFVPAAHGEEIEALSYIIAELIPNIVAVGMLMAAIPVTQKLGAAGASKLIGGAGGIGKIAIGTYAGVKLAGGLGKKAGGETFGRAHSAMKGKYEWYNKGAQKIGEGLKSSPIAGRVFIKHEADKAVKNKEAVAKHEKIMDNLTDKDKKKYVDSFKLDKNAQAEARQAMFNLMAKDSGKGLTNTRLQKMGYEKEVNGKQTFDEKRFREDYNQAVAHGMDTTNIEKYRPDLIKEKEDRVDKVKKIAADGDQSKIKSSALLNKEVRETLVGEIGEVEYNKLLQSKPQEEKNEMVEHLEKNLANDLPALKTAGNTAEIENRQAQIASLSGAENKLKRMRNVDVDVDGSIKYTGDVNVQVAKKSLGIMSNSEIMKQNNEFFREAGHFVNQSTIKEMGKYGQNDKIERIREAIEEDLKNLEDGVSTVSGIEEETLKNRKKAAKNQL